MEDFTNATKEEREAALKALNLSIACVFVPHSKSRNFKENPKVSDLSLNWTITLSEGGRKVWSGDYSQGIGHAPAYKERRFRGGSGFSVDGEQYLRTEVETGKVHAYRTPYWRFRSTMLPSIPPPGLVDVVSSLALGARSGSLSFHEFCSEFGYDSDSRKARKTWKLCAKVYREIGERLLSAIEPVVSGY